MATVRYFAAAAEAAGRESDVLSAPTLGALLDGVRSLHGDRFSRVLDASSVLHDGSYIDDPATRLAGDAVLDVLPPFAGG